MHHKRSSGGQANKGMKQTKSTPWHNRGVALAAYAQRSTDTTRLTGMVRRGTVRRKTAFSIDDLSWHDGLLLGWSFAARSHGRASLSLVFALYPDQVKSRHRQVITIHCEGLRRFAASCDVAELHDNASAGNVMDGCSRDTIREGCSRRDTLLTVLLVDGFVQVHASAFRVARTRATPRGRTALRRTRR